MRKIYFLLLLTTSILFATEIDSTVGYTGIEFQTKMLQKDNVEDSVIKKYFSILDEQFKVKSNAFTADNNIVIKAPKMAIRNRILLNVTYPLLEKGEKLFLFMPKERSPRIISFEALQSQPLNISFKTYMYCDDTSRNVVAILLHKNGKISINNTVVHVVNGGEFDGKYCIEKYGNKKMETQFPHIILDYKTIIKSKMKDNKIKFIVSGTSKRSKTMFSMIDIDNDGRKLLRIALSRNSNLSFFSMKLPNKSNQVILKFKSTNGKSLLEKIKNVKNMSKQELKDYRNEKDRKRKKLEELRFKEKKEEVIALYQKVEADEKSDFIFNDVFGNKLHLLITKDGIKIHEFADKIVILKITKCPSESPWDKFEKRSIQLQDIYKKDIRVVDFIVNDCKEDCFFKNFILNNNVNHSIISFQNNSMELFKFIMKHAGWNDYMPTPFILIINQNGKIEHAIVTLRSSLEEIKTVIDKLRKKTNKF